MDQRLFHYTSLLNEPDADCLILLGPDDCDFNLHLSNSCYAKSLDCARLQHALKCFPTLFRTGGWMALGGTHYNFLREIPILSRYEVRVSIAAWDNKWVYLVARYVSHPSKKSKSKSKSSKPHTKDTLSISSTGLPEGDIEIKLPPTPPNNALADHAPVPVLHTPGTPDSEPQVLETRRSRTPPTPVSPTFPNSASGPYPGVDAKGNGNANSNQSLSLTPTKEQADSRAIAAALRTQARVHAEPDGATLHCVAVSALCFKIGRITVPPSLALACEGLCSGPEASPHANGSGDATKSSSAPKPYSHANPPPFWPQVKRLRGSELDLRPMCAFLAGGWREVPEEERWWETAFGGEIEKKRQAGMEVVGALRKGMEEVQGL